MLREYVDWWSRQMLEWVPERVRAAGAGGVDALIVEPIGEWLGLPSAFGVARLGGGDSGATLASQPGSRVSLGKFTVDRPGFEAAVAAIGPRHPPVWLRVPSRFLLEKTISLPLGAEREVERVLSYEMDRETPFEPDEVWWSWEVAERDRARDKLSVRLSLVPKNLVADFVDVLEAADEAMLPECLLVSVDGEPDRVIPLSQEGHAIRRAAQRPMRVAAMAVAALLVLAIVLPFARQYWERMATESEIEELRSQVDEASALRRQMGGGGGEGVVAQERARLGDPVLELAAATRLMPNDTYLTDFTMQERRVTLNGQSTGAAKLIGLLAGDPSFKDPSFAAPITRIEGAKTEGFSIAAEARN